MSNRKRSWAQDVPLYRGVYQGYAGQTIYTGPYDDAGKAKRSIPKGASGGYIEMCDPVWSRVEGWERK